MKFEHIALLQEPIDINFIKRQNLYEILHGFLFKRREDVKFERFDRFFADLIQYLKKKDFYDEYHDMYKLYRDHDLRPLPSAISYFITKFYREFFSGPFRKIVKEVLTTAILRENLGGVFEFKISRDFSKIGTGVYESKPIYDQDFVKSKMHYSFIENNIFVCYVDRYLMSPRKVVNKLPFGRFFCHIFEHNGKIFMIAWDWHGKVIDHEYKLFETIWKLYPDEYISFVGVITDKKYIELLFDKKIPGELENREIYLYHLFEHYPIKSEYLVKPVD